MPVTNPYDVLLKIAEMSSDSAVHMKVIEVLDKNLPSYNITFADNRFLDTNEKLNNNFKLNIMDSQPVKVFISYSHIDENYKNELDKHLASMKYTNKIKVWEDRQIIGGQESNKEIFDNLENAKIILLLVSPDFIASPFCYSKELKRAMERHNEGTAIVIPIILRPCDFFDLEFAKFQAFPKNAKSISTWDNIDVAWQDVIQAFKKTVNFVQEDKLNK